MSAPKKINVTPDEDTHGLMGWFSVTPWEGTVEYIRADLVDKLKGYVVHADYPHPCTIDPCTCGLTELMGEIDG